MKRSLFAIFSMLCFCCAKAQPSIDLQAHRGGRGLMPENSIPAMLNGVAQGARTLELDCIISADGKVVVSHEPWMNADIMLKPDGTALSRAEQQSYAIYKMSYDSVRKFVEGTQPYAAFAQQRRIATYKPLLSELIDSVEAYVAAHHLKPVYYNIETKSEPSGDGIFNPEPERFVELLLAVVHAKGIASRVTIQSFDPRTLQVIHRRWPEQVTALLVGNKDGFDENIKRLGFLPTIYSPDFHLVDAGLVRTAHDKKVDVLPWTVNEESDMQAMAGLGVDGIISDYPDRLVRLFGSWQAGGGGGTGDIMPARIQQYEADKDDLSKVYIFPNTPEYIVRFRRYNREALEGLQALSFASLSVSDRVDYILLQREIRHALAQLDQAEKSYDSLRFALPFAAALMEIQVRRRRGAIPDAEAIARTLDSVKVQVAAARQLVEKRTPGLSKASLKRIAEITEGVRAGLKDVHTFYHGYDPMFSWWVDKPYQQADSLLNLYAQGLRSKMNADETAVLPIGEAKLTELLDYEMIPYGPKDLVDIANKQFAWCETEMKKAAAAMGFGNDWKAALEKVKQHRPAPGGQPAAIDTMAEEAIRFLEAHDLVTVPSLAKEVWGMYMLTPDEQRFAPFFLGGENILVAYPTNDMDESMKLGSLRSNSYGFSHAVVFHELIPGHNLQGFMDRRNKGYRYLFSTPFSVEGWALYWEMLLWDKGFQATPEQKIGALFWRMHRCARIIFSLNYHLGKWTPEQCVDFLVDKVGHERFSASSEVRRSFGGDYGPLYQIAYMMGGLQIRALHHAWVDSGKMTDKSFHDAFLRENSIPVEMFRATISGQGLRPDYRTQWRFAEELP